MASIQEILIDNTTCIELQAGSYRAILAPASGNNIIYMHHADYNIDFFRYDSEHPFSTAKANTETYGYPFLYLHNRLADGILKTSDHVYHLPVNETKYHNHLHGFLQTRAYTVCKEEILNDTAVRVVSEYHYDENDSFFTYLPVAFTIRMTYTLSADDGLLQEVELSNESADRMLPCGFCSHTAIRSPFIKDTDPAEYVMHIPVKERWELDDRCLPTEKRLPLSDYDKRYNTGTMDTVNHTIDNDLYTGTSTTLDGQAFHGMYTTHIPTGIRICQEVSEQFRFWCVWNDFGTNGYYCPEPLTWIINAPNLSLPASETGYEEIAPGKTYHCWQHIFCKK